MKRYQLYLDPNSVMTLDEFGKITSISRSKLIQEAIDRLAKNLSKILVVKDISPKQEFIFDSLVGAISLKGSEVTDYASKDDRKYLID